MGKSFHVASHRVCAVVCAGVYVSPNNHVRIRILIKYIGTGNFTEPLPKLIDQMIPGNAPSDHPSVCPGTCYEPGRLLTSIDTAPETAHYTITTTATPSADEEEPTLDTPVQPQEYTDAANQSEKSITEPQTQITYTA